MKKEVNNYQKIAAICRSNQSHVAIKRIILILIICFLSSRIVSFLIYAPLSHNSQGDFCQSRATKMDIKQMNEGYDFFNQKDQRIFVEKNNDFIAYNPLLHKDQKVFFLEHKGDNIGLSNSRTLSDGSPCTLTRSFYALYTLLFAISFLVLYHVFIPFFILIKRS